ncbi:adhesin transport system outer membrane protein [Rhodopseudomonas thermotolerans]|uniref:Adhesin transport system outer membrane protein n=2 Tax=Rhodopseudomonas TaxID=1073 RepID=A0A336JKG6_9BRAD|nr:MULTISPECIES: TolC family outer membrane protein [Rhodopseudomonas]RED41943.1 adhesin transport system outer membrane protein [Rhodopseudomonas pentothenatexigens]REG07404.1 adhesin transport system outer membrane protein [Rhodopseudomonas thermotolerans]SSW89303.1 adhesin transport system outer membrane protein [Rhodopseudomonas pentothenatexigens]
MPIFAATIFALLGAGSARAAEPFLILDAINQAVKSNPSVGEAAANRRATEAELRQSQGTLLPQVRLEASLGPEMIKQYVTPAPANNGIYLRGREAGVVVRQLLFDGFASINEVWRQAARVDAASFRVLERTELIGLDAAEAYIDVVRYTRLLALAEQNVQVHLGLRKNVLARFEGGRAGEGDTQQAEERVASAQAIAAEFRLSLENARAKFRKIVGIEPYNLRFPGRLADLPKNKQESLDIAYKFNPTLRAAGADVAAAKRGFDATTGAFMPTLALEGRASRGKESILYSNQYDEVSGKLVASWDIFNGGQSSWRREEAAQRMIEEQQKHARLQRGALESIDKAWAARIITVDRVAALVRDVEAARRTFAAYNKEYELGQRTLIDLLNSQNQYFNANVSLVSARGVAVFADYQLLAAMGQLLNYLKTGHPPEAELIDVHPSGFIGFKLPPVRLSPPSPGPEPLGAVAPVPLFGLFADTVKFPTPITFGDRWASTEPAESNTLFLTSGKYATAVPK